MVILHRVTFGYPYAINPENPEHLNKKENIKIFSIYWEKFYLVDIVESHTRFYKRNTNEPNLNTRKDLCHWFYQIHNKVNHKLGVPKCQNDHFQKRYEQFRAKCKNH